MKSELIGIVIKRSLMASKYGIARETEVFFLRSNADETRRYTTNDILGRGNISKESVRRAERAQLAFVERHKSNQVNLQARNR